MLRSALRDRWMDLALNYPLASVEIVLALINLSWGAPLLDWRPTFPGSRIWTVLGSVLNEHVVGAVFLVLGVAMLAGVTWQLNPIRRWVVMACSMWWIAITITFWLSSDAIGAASSQGLVISCVSLWCTWRWAAEQKRPTVRHE